MRFLLWLALLAQIGLVSLGSLPSAQAQDSEEVIQARANFQRALELEQAHDYAGALRLFRRVGQVKLTPQVRYHIAACEENLGKMVAALGGYELALQHGQGMPPGFLSEVQQSIDYLKQRIPTLTVTRGQGADGASIELDGILLGSKSIGVAVPLDPGPHVLRAKAAGYQEYEVTLTVSEGEHDEVTIDLVEIPEVVAPAPSAPEPEPVQGYGLAPYVVAGSGLVVAIVGGVLLGASQGPYNRALELCRGSSDPCDPSNAAAAEEAKSAFSTARALEVGGWVGIGVGALAIATGTTLYFLDPQRRQKRETVRSGARTSAQRFELQPAVPRADVGLSFVTRF